MVTRYSRLSTGDGASLDRIAWVKNRIPVAFLRQQIILVSLVIASSILFMITTFFLSDVQHELIRGISNKLNYGVIVDCGSSGSRAHIFKWQNSDVIHQIEFVRDQEKGIPLFKHITPGLSAFKDDPSKASDYMEPIMEFISESIPAERHFDTPVHFLATAGMRLLEVSTQREILSDITQDLKSKFDFPIIKSQVIPGELEGVYSWLSLNKNLKLYSPSLQGSKSYGMIEMGGASTQVAFELNPEIENAILKDLTETEAISAFKSEQIRLNLGPNSSVKLFTTTFLGLGVNSARVAAIDLLVRDYLIGLSAETDPTRKSNPSKYKVHLKDPCLTTSSSEIVLRPARLLSNLSNPIGEERRHQDEKFEVRLEGSGDFLSCINLLERVVNIIKKERLHCPLKKDPPCSVSLLGNRFLPYNNQHFIGLSEMFFTTNEMMNSAGPFNRTKVLHETQRICNTQYNKLLEIYSSHNGGVTKEDRVLYECFKASWLLTILHDSGLRMPVDYNNFRTVERLDDEDIDWTMGAMIAKVALKHVNSNLS